MHDQDRDDLIETILRGTVDAIEGDTFGGLRRLVDFAGRSQQRQIVDVPRPEEWDAAFFGDAGDGWTDEESNQRAQDQPGRVLSTCTGCGARVARDTSKCPRCGGIAFLDPIE